MFRTMIMIMVAAAIIMKIGSMLRAEVTPVERRVVVKKKEKKVENLFTIGGITATCYQPVPWQCNADPFNTAFGYKIDPQRPERHRYLAISKDLEKYFSPGDSVIVNGAGIYSGPWIIADRMNRRWKNRIDFLVGMRSHLDLYRNVTVIRKKNVRKRTLQ